MDIFFNVRPPSKKPTHWPSGDTNGSRARRALEVVVALRLGPGSSGYFHRTAAVS
jgi:hypothetical protein